MRSIRNFIYRQIYIFLGSGAVFSILLGGLVHWSQKQINLIQCVTVVDRQQKFVGTVSPVHEGKQIWVAEEKIPWRLKQEFLNREDKWFYYHPGIQPFAVARALAKNILAGRIRSGGSTITQQLAKNILLLREDSKFWSRWGMKMASTALALGIEILWSKERILENHLNIAYFGNQIYGVQTAAQAYFGKTLEQLNLAEIQKLVLIPVRPSRYALPVIKDTASIKNSSRHYLEYLRREEKILEREKRIFHGTLDVSLNSRLHEKLSRLVAGKIKKDPLLNFALVAIEPATGDVLAMIGSRDFSDETIDGAFNAATALRQPGSTLKPFTFFAAFAKGFFPEFTLQDEAKNFATASADESYVPQNFDRRFHGNVTLREALANSYNIPAVEILEKVGLSYFHELLKKFGFTTFTENPRHYGLAVTLGSGAVKLTELVNAYATLARHGEFMEMRWDANQKNSSREKVHAQSAIYSDAIFEILADEEARLKTFGFDSTLAIDDYKVAVKTGTSHDLKDNWTVGYNSEIAIGVWVGHSDNSSLQGTTGATGAAPLWHAAMETYLRRQVPKVVFKSETKSNRVLQSISPRNTASDSFRWLSPISGVRYRRSSALPESYQKIKAQVEFAPGKFLQAKWFLDGDLLGTKKINKEEISIMTWLDVGIGMHEVMLDLDGQQSKIVFYMDEGDL